jgi:hypothetical protein
MPPSSSVPGPANSADCFYSETSGSGAVVWCFAYRNLLLCLFWEPFQGIHGTIVRRLIPVIEGSDAAVRQPEPSKRNV